MSVTQRRVDYRLEYAKDTQEGQTMLLLMVSGIISILYFQSSLGISNSVTVVVLLLLL